MSITARILYFISSWGYIILALVIGFSHDAYITAHGPLSPFGYVALIIAILAMFAMAMVCMIKSAQD